MLVLFKFDIKRRFFREESVSTKSAHGVDQKIIKRTVPCVLQLTDILELVVHTVDKSSFPEDYLISLR